MSFKLHSVCMQIRCNFPDISYHSETPKNNFQFLNKWVSIIQHTVKRNICEKPHFRLKNMRINVRGFKFLRSFMPAKIIIANVL